MVTLVLCDLTDLIGEIKSLPEILESVLFFDVVLVYDFPAVCEFPEQRRDLFAF
jgi:hypothetical protein